MSTRTLCLPKYLVNVLYIFYILTIVICMFFIFIYLDDDKAKTSTFYDALQISVLCSLVGSSCYYVRKLYRDGMNDRVLNHKMCPYCTHTFMYYFFRPIFASVSAFFIVIGIKQGYFILSSQAPINSENFLYLSMVVSFLVGFNVSRMFKFFHKKNMGEVING